MKEHLKERIEIADIVLSYCPESFDYEVAHDPRTVYHGILSRNIKKHPGGILKPVLSEEFLVEECRNYLRHLKKPKLHLGPLEIAGLSAVDNDIQFAFDIEELRKAGGEVIYMDHRIWSILGFCNLEEEEERDLVSGLFLQEYRYDPENPVEVLLDQVDLRMAQYALVYSSQAADLASELNKSLGLDLDVYEAQRIKTVTRLFFEPAPSSSRTG